MNSCTTSRRIARGHSTDPLTLVAELVGEATHDESDTADCGLLFGARFDDDSVELHLRPIDVHPTIELVGFLAPQEWSCLGVASGAWASTYDGDATRPAMTDVDRRRVHLVYAVERSGASISVFREPGQPPVTQRHCGPSVERAAAIDDHVRRALGLPTAEAGSTLEYFTMCWIDDIFRHAADGRLARASWSDVAALHQVHVHAAAAGDPTLMRWAIDEIVRAGEVMARARTWAVLRADAIASCEAGLALCAHHDAPNAIDDAGESRLADRLEQLRWMDDGIFGRTAMGRFPPLEDLLLDLNALLEPDPYVRLVDTVDAWGLLA
jgi:hypothetical protein